MPLTLLLIGGQVCARFIVFLKSNFFKRSYGHCRIIDSSIRNIVQEYFHQDPEQLYFLLFFRHA
jgi:hypothetical protein